MYAAGDDDQAIYRWAGADVNHFIELDGAAEVLEQSFRVPLAVHSIAENISSRINSRFPKSYLPRKEEGGVQRIYSLEEIDLSRGTWLILAQANYMLTPVAESLKSGGYLFERNGHRSISEKISRAINGWEQLRKGKEVDKTVAQAIYDYMSGNGKRIARGFKQFKETEEEKMFDLATLQIHYGLNADDTMAWFDAMDKMPKLDVVYITAVLRRGEKFNAVPRISLSTIHGAKGGEADNVVLYTDLSTAALNQMGDDMHRVFYVGVTRTKDQLFIVEPEDAFRSYQI
jgi:superfamily I DNA/RNA helicase